MSSSMAKITYAMSPGQAVRVLYDYSTNTGMKQWTEVPKILDDKPYDGSSKNLSHFSSKLSRQALDLGWGNITKIQVKMFSTNMDCSQFRTHGPRHEQDLNSMQPA